MAALTPAPPFTTTRPYTCPPFHNNLPSHLPPLSQQPALTPAPPFFTTTRPHTPRRCRASPRTQPPSHLGPLSQQPALTPAPPFTISHPQHTHNQPHDNQPHDNQLHACMHTPAIMAQPSTQTCASVQLILRNLESVFEDVGIDVGKPLGDVDKMQANHA